MTHRSSRAPGPSSVCGRAATDGKEAGGKGETVRSLPDLGQAKSEVLNNLSSTDAQRGHRHAIEGFIEWYCSEPRLSFGKTVVLRYRVHLAPGTMNPRLGAVRRFAYLRPIWSC